MSDPNLQVADSEFRGVNWSRAVLAGLVATAVITISLAVSGMNIVKVLGTMLLPNAGISTQYVAGSVVHIMVGMIFAFAYAAIFSRVRPWGTLLRAAVFGTAITAVALIGMPLMGAIMGAGQSGAPANPGGAPAGSKNPCAAPSSNPGAQKGTADTPNPCAAKNTQNPCAAGKPGAAANPCQQQADGKQSAKPQADNACSRPANPCNPCAGSGSNPYAGLVSLINHLIFAVVLAFTYRRGK
jgi:hypothetical protein